MESPEEGDLNQILRPPHGGRLDQVSPENPRPAKTEHLRGQYDEQR